MSAECRVLRKSQLTDLAANEESKLPQDFDENLEFRGDFIQSLKDYLASDQRGDDADEVLRALGLDNP